MAEYYWATLAKKGEIHRQQMVYKVKQFSGQTYLPRPHENTRSMREISAISKCATSEETYSVMFSNYVCQRQ